VKEIEVVVDVRHSPDTPGLVVVKQKLIAEGDGLRPAGPTSEQRIDLAARRVGVTMGELVDEEVGYFMLAHVQNVGLTPLEVTRVAFEYRCDQPHEPDEDFPGPGDAPGGGHALEFIPQDHTKTGPLRPGEARGWYLMPDASVEAAGVGIRFAPAKYSVAVYSGGDEVGRLAGHDIRPALDSPSITGRVMISELARTVLDALSPPERKGVLETVDGLRGHDPAQWPESEALGSGCQGETYSVRVTPGLRAFVRPLGPSGIELFNLMREETLQWFRESMGATGGKDEVV
jgi:hypothetical protein